MWSEILSFLTGVLPVDTTTRLRILVVAFVCGVCFHIAWACGWVPYTVGFARADQLSLQEDKIKLMVDGQQKILVRLLTSDIEIARQQQCYAVRIKNESAIGGWSAQLRTAMQQFNEETKANYSLRDCSEY